MLNVAKAPCESWRNLKKGELMKIYHDGIRDNTIDSTIPDVALLNHEKLARKLCDYYGKVNDPFLVQRQRCLEMTDCSLECRTREQVQERLKDEPLCLRQITQVAEELSSSEPRESATPVYTQYPISIVAVERNGMKEVQESADKDWGEDLQNWKTMFRKLSSASNYSEENNMFFNFSGTDDNSVKELRDFVNESTAIVPKQFSSYRNPEVKWEDIHCDAQIIGPKNMEIKTECRHPQNNSELDAKDAGKYKVFVREYKNLYEYGKAIKEGNVTMEDHMALYKTIVAKQQKFNNERGKKEKRLKIINHNKDIPYLHFKFMCEGDPNRATCGFERNKI